MFWNFFEKKSRYYHWQIAYRKHGEKIFKTIDNPPYAWAADPFLVEYEGKVFLFAELFLYKSERNGVIGYCEYENGCFSDWKISMDNHWHLSYPNVFVKDGKLMMCPETYQKKEVSIYELVELPNKWKIHKIILYDVMLVDSTFLSLENQHFMFSFKPSFIGNEGSLIQYKISEDYQVLSEKIISSDISVARPAGNFIKNKNKIFRVCQISGCNYGEGIKITKVESVWPEYKENIVKTIYPSDILVDSNKKIDGIHTFNSLGDLEVIDIKYYDKTFGEYIASKRTKKVFTNKY